MTITGVLAYFLIYQHKLLDETTVAGVLYTRHGYVATIRTRRIVIEQNEELAGTALSVELYILNIDKRDKKNNIHGRFDK